MSQGEYRIMHVLDPREHLPSKCKWQLSSCRPPLWFLVLSWVPEWPGTECRVSRGTSYNSISFASSSDVLLPCTMGLWRDSYYCNSWLGWIYPALQTVEHFCKYIFNYEWTPSSSYIPLIILLLAVYNQLINLEATSFLWENSFLLCLHILPRTLQLLTASDHLKKLRWCLSCFQWR